MKKMVSGFTCIYGFSLIAAILLLIFKSRILEDEYLLAQLVLFEYSVLTGMLYLAPRSIVGLTTYWWVMEIVLLLSFFFNMTLIIPITIIIQSSYLLYRIAKGDESLIVAKSQE